MTVTSLLRASTGPRGCCASEYRAVARDLDRRRAARRRSARRRPAAQVPPCRTFASGRAPRGRRGGAHRAPAASSRATVERAPFDDHRAPRRGRRAARPGAGHEHAAVDEQAAVAILGEARELVEAGDARARRLERLDQRVGEPLRELVERNESRARGWGQVSPRLRRQLWRPGRDRG